MNNLKEKFCEIADKIINKYIKNNSHLTYYRQGIFFSEGFSFCNFYDIFECDIIIESGLRFGGSTRMFLNYFDNDTIIKTNDLCSETTKNDIKNTINLIREEHPKRDWAFYPGDGKKVVIDLIKKYENTDKKIAILLDGPKYDLALEIQEMCFKFNNVKFVAIHDMGQGPYNRRINVKYITNSIDKLRKLDNFIFSTDSSWYRKKYANKIDTIINGNDKVWKKFKKKYPFGCGLIFLLNPNKIDFLKLNENLYFSQ